MIHNQNFSWKTYGHLEITYTKTLIIHRSILFYLFILKSNTNEGLFTPWTMKSSQGPVKYVIGCWPRPGTTSVYTKGKKMFEWPWSSRSPKDIFQGLHYPVTCSNGFCGGRGKRGAPIEKGKGPWHENIVIIIFSWIFFRKRR